MSQLPDQHHAMPVRLRPVIHRVASASVGVVILAAIVGCTCTRRAVDTSLKHAEAKALYAKHCKTGLPCDFEKHYFRGWVRGYVAVAEGGKPCPPPVPPQPYWSHKYESDVGRQYVVTWYDGWRAGAQAAKAYATDVYHRVPAIACGCEEPCSATGEGVLPDPDVVCAHALAGVGPQPQPTAAEPVQPPAPLPEGSGDREAVALPRPAE